jgi:hypothetical protein
MRRDLFEPKLAKKNVGEEAKKSLEALKRQKALLGPAVIVQVKASQKHWRRYQAVKMIRQSSYSKLTSRLRDLAKVKAMVGDRLQFLPMPTLLEMLTLAKLSRDAAQAKELSAWVLMSLKGQY